MIPPVRAIRLLFSAAMNRQNSSVQNTGKYHSSTVGLAVPTEFRKGLDCKRPNFPDDKHIF